MTTLVVVGFALELAGLGWRFWHLRRDFASGLLMGAGIALVVVGAIGA